MNSQLFFFLNLVFGVAFLAWFLSARKSERPTKLKMRPGEEPPSQRMSAPVFPRAPEAPAAAMPPPSAPPPRPAEPERFAEPGRPAMRDVSPGAPRSKALNVLFLYNGHDWDAYEVLGLPAGTGLPIVTKRYQELIRRSDAGQLEFYEAAYQAILKKA